jgi:hypothetical protein
MRAIESLKAQGIRVEACGKPILNGLSLALAALPLLLASPAPAKRAPRAVRVYTGCVLENFRHPGAEKGATFDAAQDLAKAQCGNLRPAAVAVLRRTTTRTMTKGGDTPESAAQALLDITILEQIAAIWAEWHPEEVYHGR